MRKLLWMRQKKHRLPEKHTDHGKLKGFPFFYGSASLAHRTGSPYNAERKLTKTNKEGDALRFMTNENLTCQWILEACMDLITRYPLQEITVSSIAIRAGVSRRTFYRHFPSAEDALRECCAQKMREVQCELKEQPDSLHDRVGHYLETLWDIRVFILPLMERYADCLEQSTAFLDPFLASFTPSECQFLKAGFSNLVRGALQSGDREQLATAEQTLVHFLPSA